ncbi:MAG: hypothetical protein VX642_02750 [Bdellovibrionota bacterium]|nr:hypothetical protein [Bdellovibrionota bacterium]
MKLHLYSNIVVVSALLISCVSQESIHSNASEDQASYIVTEGNFPKVKFQFINSKSHGLDRMEAAYKTPDLGMKSKNIKKVQKQHQNDIKKLRASLNQLEGVNYSDWENESKNFDEDFRRVEENYNKTFKLKTAE